jgi:hypothetical protein
MWDAGNIHEDELRAGEILKFWPMQTSRLQHVAVHQFQEEVSALVYQVVCHQTTEIWGM